MKRSLWSRVVAVAVLTVGGATPGVAYDARTDERSFSAAKGFLAEIF